MGGEGQGCLRERIAWEEVACWLKVWLYVSFSGKWLEVTSKNGSLFT